MSHNTEGTNPRVLYHVAAYMDRGVEKYLVVIEEAGSFTIAAHSESRHLAEKEREALYTRDYLESKERQRQEESR